MNKKIALIFSLSICGALASPVIAKSQQLVDYVNPFIGTSNVGATHPGAQYPHGMASVVPFNVAFKAGKENKFEKDASWHSRPYVHDNSFLTGFSHVNLSGVGCPELGSILTMPTSGKLQLDPEQYGSQMGKQQSSPGYYSVELDKYGVKAEMTSTLRTGLSRYTFKQGESHILLNLGLGLSNESGSMLKIVSDTEVEGFRTIGTFCYNPEDVRPVYFVAKFSKAAKQLGAFKKMPEFKNVEADWVKYNNIHKPYPNYRQPMAGDNIGAYFSFDTANNETIEVKVGVSYVSIENARENLNAEQPDFNFDKVRQSSKNKWNSLLSRVKLSGTDENKTLFYSALYHMLVHPTIIQDSNGDYPLMEQYGKGNTGGKNRYSIFSLWDTHRNLHPFLSLVYPELQSDMVNSMVAIANESGWLPKWELLSMETGVMVGDPATVVIADTYLRGITDFDVEAAYKAAVRAATQQENNKLRPDNREYLELGYVPVDNEGTWDGTVSTSLEYYIADWNLAQLAKVLNKPEDYQRFYQQSMGYKKLLDPSTGMLRPKLANGRWLTPYDPELGRNFEPAPGYVEGNAWNYRFYVPHDIPGLIELLGGEAEFEKQLSLTFSSDNFDMANEPDITYPFLYNFVSGSETKTSNRVTQLIKQHYHNKPGGIPGNDDAGTLSAWLAFSMLGIYPVTPGDMNYAIFQPAFDKVEIELNQDYYPGKKLIIEASSSANQFNSSSVGSFISHQQLTSGGKLKLKKH